MLEDALAVSEESRNRTAWLCHGPEVHVEDLVAGTLPGALRPGDGPALLFPAESEHWLGHRALDERSRRTASWLLSRGLAPGDRVLLCGGNSAALVVAYLAILRAGGTVVLANPAYTADELAHLVDDSQAAWAFVAQPASALVDVANQVSLDEPLPELEPGPLPRIGTADVALLAYTSGTTGAPKGVPLTHANLLSSIRAAMHAWRWSAGDVLVHSLPLSHQHGLGGVHATLLAGSSAVVLPRFDAAELGDAIQRHGATVLFAVPAVYERLVAEVPGALGAPSLRLAVSGSAPLSPDLAGRIAAVMGEPPLERYGSTESGLDVSNPLDGPRVPGTVGLPLPGVELRIGTDSGDPVEDGTEGEILLRGPQVFSGYWKLPDATAEAFHSGGWFRTGDLGRIDAGTGYLRITGRKKELVITGGLNVYPREVELALEKHPAVSSAAVAGLPSRRWGEQVTAWVVAESRVSAEEVVAHARKLLAPYKCPKQVFFVDALPRNSMGKLRRSELREPLDTSELDKAVAKLWRAEF
ncbi:class I adenylate-forming enzyme family protein [Saccharopolyspora erythraea]|uniref:class I adenylate-forming enzyme family protein n=1 Tax=Saccharopolyspora erythraea TaxID=1836 RepID=UPI002012D108|nr:AMP-binding protein [Saccharopolyspora erythraea]